jgi:membrane associated rhomboid family serine protease
MAFKSNSPISLMFPPFRGFTRRIILSAIVVYFATAALRLVSEQFQGLLLNFFRLHAGEALHPQVWQLITYPFVQDAFVSVALSLLSLWFFATPIEDDRGSRWLIEYFLVASVGGGIVATILSLAAGDRVEGLGKDVAAAGLWPFVLAVMVAYGKLHANEQVRVNFLFWIKAKYLAVIYVLIYLAIELTSKEKFEALVALCNAAVGFAFLIWAPKRGVRAGISERWFGLRNSFYRAKRRRAAKKFTVYMRKQGKDVSLDDDGRYVDPDGKPRDPNDKRWMN